MHAPLFSFGVILLLTVFVLPNLLNAAAGVPLIINFQGRLYDKITGELLGGTGTDFCFKFSIYDADTGPAKIWPSGAPTEMVITVREGVFDASVGSGADTLDLPFTDDQAFMNVEVATYSGTCGSFETLSPRPQIVSSGFAINSKTVGGFTPAQSATDDQIPALTSGALILGHATTAGLTSVGAAPLAIDAGTSGILNLNNTSTGDILLGGGVGSTGCTLTNATGALACTALLSGSGLSLTSANTTEVTTASALSLSANSLTTGTGIYAASSSLTSGTLLDLAITGTAGLTNQKGLNISLSGANASGAQTTYGAYLSNTHTGTSNNVGLYATASGGTNNYAAIFAAGNVGIGTTAPVSGLNVTTGRVATANYGVLSLGESAWDGSTSGFFTGDSGGTVLAINGPNSATGNLIDIQRSGSSRFKMNMRGATTLAGGAVAGGETLLTITPAAHTAITADRQNISFGSNTFTLTGGYATQRFNLFGQSTITAASPQNISSEASTLNITGAPISAGSATIANSIGLRIATGTSVASGVTNAYGLYVDAPTGASNNYSAVFQGGNVGIGNASPTKKLTVSDGVILSNFGTNSTPTALGGATPNVDINSVYVSGKYAYLGLDSDGGAGNEFRIYDIHNPSSPTVVGGVSYNFNAYTVFTSGNYAYVGFASSGDSANDLRIYDITNTSSPSLTGGIDVDADVNSVVVVGRYLYLMKSANAGTCSGATLTGCEFSIYDITNPASPVAIGGVNLSIAGNAVYVQGKYAYLGLATAAGNDFRIYDISNPFTPSSAGGADVAASVNSVVVSGKYAYLALSTGNELTIYNVADPSSLSLADDLDMGAAANSVQILGKYVYLGLASDGGAGKDFRIVNASDPTDISSVGGVDTTIAVNEIFISGKYAYLALDTVSGDEFRIYDISGLDAPSAVIGALAAGALSVSDNATVDNNLYIGNALNIGVGGINSAGSIVINNDMIGDGATSAIAGIFGNYTFSPNATGGTQVGNRFVVNNAPVTTANTSINQIVRTVDNTTLANLVRGIEIVSNAGSNTAGTNTGIRTTGATYGIQAFSSGKAGTQALPAAIYGESTGDTQGDVLRLFSSTMTTAAQMAHFYHTSTSFSGTGLLMNFGNNPGGGGAYSGNFIDLQVNSSSKFKVTSAGVVSMGLSGTASTTAVCSSLANSPTTPTAGVAYEIRDCSGAPAADYAEMYPVEEGLEVGDIVATGEEMVTTYDTTLGNIDWEKEKGKITRLVKSSRAYQGNVIGIISDNTGDFSSTGYNIKEEDNPMPVALSGRVPVKVATDSQAILPGDYLTTSSVAGRATRAGKAGTVIGKALEPWQPGESETVMVFVEQGYWNGASLNAFAGVDLLEDENGPSLTLAQRILAQFLADLESGEFSEEALDFSELFTDRIAAGLEIITPRLVASAVDADSINARDATFAGLTFFGNSDDLPSGITFGAQAEFLLPPIFNKDTAGFAIIKEGDRRVRIDFEDTYVSTPVVSASITFEATDNIDDVTADDLLQANVTFIVFEKDESGFTILLNKSAPYNIRFSWIALGVKDANIFESLGGGLILNTPLKISAPKRAPQSSPGTSELEESTPDIGEEALPDPEPTPISDSAPTPESAPEPTPTPESTPETAPSPAPVPAPPAGSEISQDQ